MISQEIDDFDDLARIQNNYVSNHTQNELNKISQFSQS